MASTRTFGHIAGSLATDPDAPSARPDRSMPFRICILGDFSGRANRASLDAGALAGRRLIEVDRDNFDDVLARLKPRLRIGVGEEARQALDLGFDSLDDFHPDAIVDRLSLFAELRALRVRLQSPATFEAAANEVGRWAGPAPDAAPEAAAEEQPASGYTTDDLFAAIDETEPPRNGKAAGTGEAMAAELIRDIVAPFVVPKPDPRQAELLDSVDAATAAGMRAVLHHPDFQALEALWRCLDLLVRRLETGTDLKLVLVDVAKAELAEDLCGTENLRDSGLYRLLVESSVETPGGQPWGLWLGGFTAEATAVDADLIGRLARLAARAGAPVLAGAAPGLVGCPVAGFGAYPDPADWREPLTPEADAAWQALRDLPDSAWIGLALPRVLMRHPYGKAGGPIHAFAFEELHDAARHDDFLWGNPAFLAACLIGESFSLDGWSLRPGQVQQFDGLPVHVFVDDDGDRAIKPCSEVLLTERASDRFAERGIIPVWWVRDTDQVRVVPFRSLSSGNRALKGRWAG